MLLRFAIFSRPLVTQRLRWSHITQVVKSSGHEPLQPGYRTRKTVKLHSVAPHSMSEVRKQSNNDRQFDKSEFSKTLKLKALKVQAKQCQSLMKFFAG